VYSLLSSRRKVLHFRVEHIVDYDSDLFGMTTNNYDSELVFINFKAF
jgi:hypothetical protein